MSLLAPPGRRYTAALVLSRAQVVLGLPYSQKIDVWSLGAILAELTTGRVLFKAPSSATLLARQMAVTGTPALPCRMLRAGRHTRHLFTPGGALFEPSGEGGAVLLCPKPSSLHARLGLPAAHPFADFLGGLLQMDPARRVSAAEALSHPWLAGQHFE